MPRLPPLSGRKIVRVPERSGWTQAGQSGSHVKLRRNGVSCIVPLHPEVKKGTLAGILRQARMTIDEFMEASTQ